MTQSQIAALLGKSDGSVITWKIDRSKPDVDTLIKLAQLFLLHFSNVQQIRDNFVQSQTFDLSVYIDFVTDIYFASAGANRLMHTVSTVPVCNLLQQAEVYGSEEDRRHAWKIYRAYYERFIYDIPAR